MPYTDPATVRVALSPGGDDTDLGSAASLSDADLLAKISDATDEVDSKLGDRYTVPFTDPIPALVGTITTAISAYLATLTYRRGDPLVTGDPVVLAYQRAEQMLTQLQAGTMALPNQTTGGDPEPLPVWFDPRCDTLLDARNPRLQYPEVNGFGGGIAFVGGQ